MRQAKLIIPLLAVLVATMPVYAAEPPAPTQSTEETTLSEGTVKKVDKSTGKVTIKHGPLLNLDMPAMTMVFRVKESAWLDQLQPGDTIRFRAEKINGAYTVVRYESVK